MSGVKGRSGRKKKTLTSEKARQRIQALLPYAIETLGETVNGTNIDRLRYEAAVEIKDSALGKPKQQTDLSIEGGEKLGGGAILELFRQLAQYRQELIAEERKMIERGEDAVNGTS